MKPFTLLLLLAAFALTSCSSTDDGNDFTPIANVALKLAVYEAAKDNPDTAKALVYFLDVLTSPDLTVDDIDPSYSKALANVDPVHLALVAELIEPYLAKIRREETTVEFRRLYLDDLIEVLTFVTNDNATAGQAVNALKDYR